jgi:serine/threonine protein phosphatase PrpC
MKCPHCGEEVAETDQFCESCGQSLSTAPQPVAVLATEGGSAELGTQLLAPPGAGDAAPAGPTCSCGGLIDDDGFCTVCGLRAPSERDHFSEQPAAGIAAVCDKGIVHRRNEDAVAVGATGTPLIADVCDGVTNATDSDIVSLAAARAARDVLQNAPVETGDTVEHWRVQHNAAAAAAQDAAMNAAQDAHLARAENPPSCTYVAAIADGATLAAAWIGDSRAYWFGDDGAATQLSVDDSWATAEIERGVDRATAEADPRAHSITRWLGPDSPGGDPGFTTLTAPGPGWLVVCSDGLWNYCSEAPQLRDLVAQNLAASGNDPMKTADALVAWANTQGGHDNITVALARAFAPEPAPRSD